MIRRQSEKMIRRQSEKRRSAQAALPVMAMMIVLLPFTVAARAERLGGAPAASVGFLARVLSVNDSAHMHAIHSSGNTVTEEGPASGTLPGTVRAKLTLSGSTVRSGFTIYLHGGSISGHSTGSLHVGHGVYASFGGSLTVSHGSGHYAHASGTGNLYGTINRDTDEVTVQVIGRLHV
jgi:hypothetical protein